MMIDLTLLPEKFHKDWVAITAQMEGEGFHWRTTLRNGDILMPVRLAMSVSVFDDKPETIQRAETLMREWRLKNTIMVGRDASLMDLYPDLWSDWRWVDDQGGLL